ncbi:nitrilase-related carbon-nitrogen hydrolase [Saccharopolyspora sp. NPDC050389]|uniref:nitrilase-related carbon-nitrogen hydrolase n=1 Tax=Saccharopolyspora sp. NPDC050389 TaxID=3155516 RepID=UPI0033C4A474
MTAARARDEDDVFSHAVPFSPPVCFATRAAAHPMGHRSAECVVVLPELWTTGAWAYDDWQAGAEPVDGPTVQAMSAAARSAAVWLHAGTVVGARRQRCALQHRVGLRPDGCAARYLPQDPPLRLRHR